MDQTTSEQVVLVELGNFPAVQVNGVVPISIPGRTDTLYFKANKVESFSNGDFKWFGDLIAEDSCQDGQYSIACAFGYLTLIRKDNRYFGEIVVDNDEVYQIRDIGGGKSALILLDKDALVQVQDCITPIGVPTPAPAEATNSVYSSSACPVKVLVLYTTIALAEHPDILDIIDMCIFQNNTILKNSAVLSTQLELLLAGTEEITDDVWVESDRIIDDVNSAIANTTLQALRIEYDADLVVILTQDEIHTQAFGAVTSFGDFLSAEDSAFTVLEPGFALAPNYIFSHEIGHLFGARHDRTPQDCAQGGDNSGLPYAHGEVMSRGVNTIITEKEYAQTIMSRCASISSIPRIPNYSNPDVKWKKQRTGTSWANNNARVMREAACRIGGYIVSESPIMQLNFPDKWCPDMLVLGNVDINGGVPQPWQCTWQHSYDGFTWSAPTVNACTGYSATTPINAGDRLYIRVTGGNVNGPMLTRHTDVLADNTMLNCPRENQQFELHSGESTVYFNLYPNPATEEVYLSYTGDLTGLIDIQIYTTQGQKRLNHTCSAIRTHGFEPINLSSLPTGMYFLVVQGLNTTFRLPLVIKK